MFDVLFSQLDDETTLQIVTNNLNAIHQASSENLKNESSEKLKRALLHQVRSNNVEDIIYRRKDSPK